MVQTANTIFRDFETDGVMASGTHKPKKSEIRPLLTRLENIYDGALAGGALVYENKADLTADTTQADNAMAWVLGDDTVANNGIYQFDGAAWTRLGDLPYSYIKASNAGAGTANAIVATTSIPIPAADGGALVALPIVATNDASPVTVSFNGAAALTVKTSSGNDVSVGGLKAGMIVDGYVSGSTFRLRTDQAGSAVVADAEAAADRAEAAAAEAANVISSQFASKSAAVASSLATAPDFIQTAGYASAGDGGTALYKKVASEPAHDGKFSITLSDGATVVWYELAVDAVKPRMFGTGDGATELQAAIDYAVAKSGQVEVQIPHSMSLASGVTHDSATAVTIRGVGRRVSKIIAGATFAALLTLGASSVGFQAYNLLFDSLGTTTKGTEIALGSVDPSFYECKWQGSNTTAQALCEAKCAGFPEWHNCHFSSVGSGRGLDLNCTDASTNQVWRLENCRFSGTGNGFNIVNTGAFDPQLDVEGGRATDCHFINTGAWNVTLGPSFDSIFSGCTFGSNDTTCVVIGSKASSWAFKGCYFGGTAAQNAILLDILPTAGNDGLVEGCNFNYGDKAISVRATANAGEYQDGLRIIGNTFRNIDNITLDLDSVMNCIIDANTDHSTPSASSYVTRSTNAVNGSYTFDNNNWHTGTPVIYSTAASYRHGFDTGIVMRNRFAISSTTGNAATGAHGLSRTPTWVGVTPTSNCGTWYVSTKGAANISVGYGAAGAQTFDCEAAA